MAKRIFASKRQEKAAVETPEPVVPVEETPEPVAPVEEVPETPVEPDPAPESVSPEAAASVGEQLREMAEKYEIPETFGGPNQKQRTILSISSFREVGGIMYAVAYCDDLCTYDVPLELKKD